MSNVSSNPNCTTSSAPAHAVDVNTPDWRFFDRIYCISLADRPDRAAEARRQFQRVGLIDHVEFVLVHKHPTHSEQGIFESHQLCLQRGLDAGARTILIFEDDILFDRFNPKTLNQFTRFLRENQAWQMTCLGCFVSASQPTGYPSVRKIRYKCTTHAMAVRRAFAERLAGLHWVGRAYDDVIRDLAEEQTFAVYPSFAFQSDSSTSNDKLRRLDRVRRLFGGLQRLQKWNEFMHSHKAAIILGHLVMIAALIGVVWWLRN